MSAPEPYQPEPGAIITLAGRVPVEGWEVGLGGTEPGDREALISYSGRCSECGASATFKTTIEVKP